MLPAAAGGGPAAPVVEDDAGSEDEEKGVVDGVSLLGLDVVPGRGEQASAWDRVAERMGARQGGRCRSAHTRGGNVRQVSIDAEGHPAGTTPDVYRSGFIARGGMEYGEGVAGLARGAGSRRYGIVLANSRSACFPRRSPS